MLRLAGANSHIVRASACKPHFVPGANMFNGHRFWCATGISNGNEIDRLAIAAHHLFPIADDFNAFAIHIVDRT